MPKKPTNLLTTIAPNDHIDFVVQAKSDSSCLSTIYAGSISHLVKHGINTTVASFLARSATMFIQRCSVNASSTNLHELNLAYALFAFVAPSVQKHNGQHRLIIQKSINSRLQAVITEMMALGATLLAGEKVFNIPLKFWYPTSKLDRFDFESQYNKSRFALEAKGRIDTNNSVTAENSIINKFKAKSTIARYDHVLGVIYTPCFCENKKQTVYPKDILLIDPDNRLPPLDDLAGVRSILRHYSYIYKAQGYIDLFSRLIAIADNKESMLRYINQGIPDLSKRRYYRTSFLINNTRYLGTAWSDKPELLNPINEGYEKDPCYIWGIKESIHDAIFSGTIDRLLKEEHEENDFYKGKNRYILLGDGSAIGWAPSSKSLLEMP